MDPDQRRGRKSRREKESSFLDQWAELVLPYLSPPDIASAAATCKSLRRISNSITAVRSSDASRSLENHPIPFHPDPTSPYSHPYSYFVFATSPYSHPYSYFFYAPSPLLSPPSSSQPWGSKYQNRHHGNPFPIESFLSSTSISGSGSGCRCRDCSADPGTCPCSGPYPEEIGVTRECGPGCGCGPDCTNRSTQRGVAVRLRIVRDANKGWGLHAAEFVKRGQFICEYAGEFLTTDEARRRQRTYDELASSGKLSPALLVVREHLPSGKACLRVNIDATKAGNVARFINHSCDGGNLLSALVRSSGSLIPRLCFFAAKDISESEELTFSYGEARLRPKDLPCFCGSDVCCGLLPSEET